MNSRVVLLGLLFFIATETKTKIKVRAQAPVEVAPKMAETSDNNQQRPWLDWFARRFKRKPPLPEVPGSTRGSDVCLLSPTTHTEDTALWQSPVFIWRGSVAKVGLRQVGSSTMLWSQLVSPNTDAQFQTLHYGGPTLEAGKSYEWGTFAVESDPTPQVFRKFTVMHKSNQGSVTRAWLQESVALQKLEATPADWTQRQMEFFLERGLMVNTYQLFFIAAVQDRWDQEGLAGVQEAVKDFC